ncbi:MAG: hypothetical protein CMO55_28575 [Verrucomicrobiales bacterium]|nr:hypothetical protein [Verrucomicrobiales bacterium]
MNLTQSKNMVMKRRRRYTAEFKQQAMELVEAGRPAAEVAEEFDIELSCLYAWMRRARATQEAQGGSDVVRAEGEHNEADELRRLRRENARLRSENVILKKAAIIIGTEFPRQTDER